MINAALVDRCRNRLIKAARADKLFEYGELAKHVGVVNQGLGPYLDAIYRDDVKGGRPDMTLSAVYKGAHFGKFNFQGAAAKSVEVDPSNAADVARYNQELAAARAYWKSH